MGKVRANEPNSAYVGVTAASRRDRKAPSAPDCEQANPKAEQCEVTVADTEAFLSNYMAEFHAFIGRVLSVLPRDKERVPESV